MKKILFILLFSSVSLHAQGKKHEKIRALKTAYITDKLALTAAEAEEFWPIYNNFTEEFHSLKVQRHSDIYQKLRSGIDKLTDSEANELIEKNLSLEAKELALKKQMSAELRKVLSPKKIILLKKSENDFKRELLKRYRHGRGDRKNKP